MPLLIVFLRDSISAEGGSSTLCRGFQRAYKGWLGSDHVTRYRPWEIRPPACCRPLFAISLTCSAVEGRLLPDRHGRMLNAVVRDVTPDRHDLSANAWFCFQSPPVRVRIQDTAALA
jgi:hypothetical protein